MNMPVPVKILLVEDSAADAELILHELHRAGFAPIYCASKMRLSRAATTWRLVTNARNFHSAFGSRTF